MGLDIFGNTLRGVPGVGRDDQSATLERHGGRSVQRQLTILVNQQAANALFTIPPGLTSCSAGKWPCCPISVAQHSIEPILGGNINCGTPVDSGQPRGRRFSPTPEQLASMRRDRGTCLPRREQVEDLAHGLRTRKTPCPMPGIFRSPLLRWHQTTTGTPSWWRQVRHQGSRVYRRVPPTMPPLGACDFADG